MAALTFVFFCHACAKNKPSQPVPAPHGQTVAAAHGEAGPPEVGPREARPSEVGPPEASPGPSPPKPTMATPIDAPLAPLANGKRIRIRKLEDDMPALEITVPPGFKLRIDDNPELLPSAHLVGPDLEIVIQQPEGGFFTLAEDKDMTNRSDAEATFFRAVETPEGYLLIDRNNLSGMGPRYGAIVSRPRLKVTCTADALALSDAERAAAVCLTLRSARSKVEN